VHLTISLLFPYCTCPSQLRHFSHGFIGPVKGYAMDYRISFIEGKGEIGYPNEGIHL